jgi:hypothetical protein
MAISGKYGKLNIPKIGEAEPVFILRAQDRLAQGVVEIYRVLAASHGYSSIDSLDREIDRFRNWEGKRKMPD